MRVTYSALVAFVFAASCSKEAAEPDVYDWMDGSIYFRTSLRDVASSRAQDMTLQRLESFQVTCFNTGDFKKDANGFVSPYFENATFIRKDKSSFADTYVSSPDEEPRNWPDNDRLLRFFAFSPSLSAMTEGNSALDSENKSEYFNLINSTVAAESSINIGYRLGNVHISPDISRQFDFVTAEATGEKADFIGGVDLEFSHQLCQVELRAWGNRSDYDFEIAGVRIGNPVVEGSFVFADDSAPDNKGKWETPNGGIKDKVEYIYQLGDNIFKINEHSKYELAASIMGKGGCAMVIPTDNTKWEAFGDPNIGSLSYSTDKMYFSILIRVTDPSTGKIVYPYPVSQNKMTVISFAIDKDGTIVKRLYAGEKAGTYFTDSELQHPYEAANGEDVLDFGWAAVPVDADWSSGKKYIYTLNYSEGIGLHDPADPEPGKPIKGQGSIAWGVSVGSWDYAEKDENYDPDLKVPGFDE